MVRDVLHASVCGSRDFELIGADSGVAFGLEFVDGPDIVGLARFEGVYGNGGGEGHES